MRGWLIITLSPSHCHVAPHAGQTALAIGRIEGGFSDLERAAGFPETREHAVSALARYLLSRGDTGEALRRLDEALRAEPGAVSLWQLRASTHWTAGDTEAARADLERVLALNPSDAWARARLEEIRSGASPPDAP